MAKGTIPTSSIPGWPSPPAGLFEACEAVLGGKGYATMTPDGLETTDVAAINAVLSSFVGSATELALAKARKQIAFKALFDANFDLAKFIDNGTATNITAANVGTFLATITNNYRSKKAAIASAASLAALNAIDINSGWPSNP